MKKLKVHLVATSLVLIVFAGTGNAQEESRFSKEGYTQLFNGKDLNGWKIPDGDNGHWSVIDGVIDYDARSETDGDKNLWSEKEYKDFTLHVEWRFKGFGDHLFAMPIILPGGDYATDANGKVIRKMVPNSDSGILLKGAGQTNLWCWPVGSGELWSIRIDKSLSAEVRASAVPKENADKPVGQWNSFDVTIIGTKVSVVNNGILVIDNVPYPAMDVTGPIGFQHHGGIIKETGKLRGASSLVQFRNIWIKEL